MLKNKLALVTGAAQGIGEIISRTFAKEGATIALVDINKKAVEHVRDELYVGTQLPHSTHICDVSNSTQVKELFQNMKKIHDGKVPTIIVNNAGIYLNKKFQDINEQEYDRLMNVNVKSTYLITQQAVRELIPLYLQTKLEPHHTFASVINISSLSGKNGCEYENIYSATKAALDGLSRSLAKELGQYKIRCNSILPGLIRTKMLTSEDRKEFVDKLAAMTTLKRIGEAEEVAQVCLFLASDMSSYITGTSIDINGGLAF